MTSNLKQSCTTINKLFQQQNFFEYLCQLSNNDIEEVINNINLIINYYLSTEDFIYTYPLQDLLTIAKQTPSIEGILFHPSNQVDELKHSIIGLNSTSIIDDSRAIELETLECQVSFNNRSTLFYCAQITKDIKEAINLSHQSPYIVYKSILKQPTNKELPIVVGTKETNYYHSILEIRLKNIPDTYRKTATKKAKRILKRYIGKDSLLVLFPKQTKSYTITEKDLSKKETPIHIPSKYLSFIRIPSRYKLLSICAQNKQLRNGELLDINTGHIYETKEQQEEQTYHVYYSRYENLDVTSEFEYTNSELTQDINYDIDLIYGNLDTNNSREKVDRNPYKNIDFIKSRDDVHVRKTNGKYHIRNGRHRLLYLKHFYVSNYHTYQELNELEKLHNLVTIPASVERAIESPHINDTISKIKELCPKTIFLKTNINNDEPELLIIFDNKTYITKNEQELDELYNLLSNNNLDNKYYIGINSSLHNINYEDLIDYLIVTLKEKIYDMSLTDIIRYLTTSGFYQDNKYYLVSDLNYFYLYFEYVDLQHYIQIRRLFNKDINIIEETEDKLLKKEIGERILSLIKDNPDLLDLEWKDFYEIISSIEEFKQYTPDFLESAANYAGYQKERLIRFCSNDLYTKKKRI